MWTHWCDLSNQKGLLSMFPAIKAQHEGVDVCINNAGLPTVSLCWVETQEEEKHDQCERASLGYLNLWGHRGEGMSHSWLLVVLWDHKRRSENQTVASKQHVWLLETQETQRVCLPSSSLKRCSEAEDAASPPGTAAVLHRTPGQHRPPCRRTSPGGTRNKKTLMDIYHPGNILLKWLPWAEPRGWRIFYPQANRMLNFLPLT